MARGVADIIEIVVLAAGAHAFLRGDGALIGTLLDPGKHVLELHHAGIGEHQRRVVARHQRRRRHDLVGDDGTISWPLSAKNFRNVDLISLTPLILVQSQKHRGSAANSPFVPRNAFRQGG